LHVGNPILEEEKASWESNVPIVAIGTEPQQNWEAPIQVFNNFYFLELKNIY
jgi:hypothetical protein